MALGLPSGLSPSTAMACCRFDDSPTALRATMRVPEGDIGTAAIEGVQSGKLTGWSSEFMPLIERAEAGVNTVFRALRRWSWVSWGNSGVLRIVIVQLRQGHNLLISGPAGAG